METDELAYIARFAAQAAAMEALLAKQTDFERNALCPHHGSLSCGSSIPQVDALDSVSGKCMHRGHNVP